MYTGKLFNEGGRSGKAAAGCSTEKDFHSDVIDISVIALYANLQVVQRGRGWQKGAARCNTQKDFHSYVY
ncbi:hypothetical protein P3L10_023786 [Capsicum annuum]